MDEFYDVVILGTGLTECILSGLLSVDGKKVLHLDKNSYYGGESTSLPLEKVYEHFGQEKNNLEKFGKSKDWNVDLIPKFLMAKGLLVKLLIHTGVTKYLDFKVVDGNYVEKDKKTYKVPASEVEALSSGLMGIFEKRRFKKFLTFVSEFDPNNHVQVGNMQQTPMTALFEKFSLDDNTASFTGHALALWTNDSYKAKPAIETIMRIRLYCESLACYGKSPFLYPLYGLGELPQGFARLSAVYGGTYMLDTPVLQLGKSGDFPRKKDANEIANEVALIDLGGDGNSQAAPNQKSNGHTNHHIDDSAHCIKTKNGLARCNKIIADPSYFPNLVKQNGWIIRCICFINQPIPNTDNSKSCQIIIPFAQAKRNFDVYVSFVSYEHCIAAQGWYVATVSTQSQAPLGTKPTPEQALHEIMAGLELLPPVSARFIDVSPYYVPINDGKENHIYISKSYDATSHFESTCDDVLKIYESVTGFPFDFSKVTCGLADDTQ